MNRPTQAEPRVLAVCSDRVGVGTLKTAFSRDVLLDVVCSVSETLRVAAENPPELILIDLEASDVDGNQLCRRVRSDPGLSRSRVMLLSSDVSRDGELQAYRAGADDYLTKPLDAEILRARADILLRRRSVEEATVQMKSELLNLLAHEIRTPLTGVLPPAEILAAEEVMDDEQRRMWGQMILDNGRRLALLAERGMLLSELRSGSRDLKLEAIELGDLMHEVVQSLAGTGDAEQRVRVDVGIDAGSSNSGIHAGIDQDLVRTAFLVLLESARAFDPDDRRVSVRLWIEGSAVQIAITVSSVADPSAVQLALETFAPRRADDQVVGSDLGLALVRRILEAHGGHIEVRSEPDQVGFHCRLPHTT